MSKKKSKGMTREAFDKLAFQLLMQFAKEHNLSGPKEFEALIAEKGKLYYSIGYFKAFCDHEGIRNEKEWNNFLEDNPEVPR
jgi:hypothetical protein